MFDVEAYFQRIDYSGPADRTWETLRDLHKKHLVSIAFDNSDTIAGRVVPQHPLDTDVDASFEKIVLGGCGGACLELNGLFHMLLRELGFETLRLSAGVRQPSGSYSPDLSHTFTGVRLDGELWLADVGFAGPAHLEPLRLTTETQDQYGCQYRIAEHGGYHVLFRKSQSSDWHAVHRFLVRPRELAEWDGFFENFTQFSPESLVAKVLVCSRALDNGQMMVVGKRYFTVRDGYEQIRSLVDPVEYQEILDSILKPPAAGSPYSDPSALTPSASAVLRPTGE